jgi:hypothetical protein
VISKEEVDFQEHHVGNLWVVYSRETWPNKLEGDYKTPLFHFVCILCPYTKLDTCP